jgi:hypothetical protein
MFLPLVVMEAKMGWNEGVPAPASRRQQIAKRIAKSSLNV